MEHRTTIFLFVTFCSVHSMLKEDSYFSEDFLTPYSGRRHGSRRFTREIAECQHVKWENRTYEEFDGVSQQEPGASTAHYELYRFADAVADGLRRRYLVGSIVYLEQPYYTFSVLEPGHPGGCEVEYWSARRSTVRETAARRFGGCKLAINAGYFDVHSGRCLGNIVSDGRIVQTSNDEQNANFGIREDGTINVGYIPDREIRNTSNPFRQLVSGVVWLVRNGSSFVNESMKLECASHEDTGKMETFINVISARTAIGHDANGRLVIAQVNGQTHHRGANLHEFADLLLRRGVVNAINLDGGGSSTFINNQVLINYPSDHCAGFPEYRCERQVSTIVCIHDVQCIEPQCSGHGSCDLGKCHCELPWIGEACARLNCSLVECYNNGSCLDGLCSCTAGWSGDFCNETCPTGKYGLNCQQTCYCYGRSFCDPVSGTCMCPDGYYGYGCWQVCQDGYFGQNCQQKCSCSEHGRCSPFNGSCTCQAGWTGSTCNDTALETRVSSIGGAITTATSESLGDSALPALFSSDSKPHPTSVGVVKQDNVSYRSGCEPALGAMVNSTCQLRNTMLVKSAVAIVIVTGFVSVAVHMLICWVCHKRTLRRHLNPNRTTRTRKMKRRKLRKKPAFMRLPLQSSSDCSI